MGHKSETGLKLQKNATNDSVDRVQSAGRKFFVQGYLKDNNYKTNSLCKQNLRNYLINFKNSNSKSKVALVVFPPIKIFFLSWTIQSWE